MKSEAEVSTIMFDIIVNIIQGLSNLVHLESYNI